MPYVFALITAGIPLLILETAIGHRYECAALLTFARANRKTEWIAWWQTAVSFVISTYYAVILAWALMYAVFSFSFGFGENTEGSL